MTIKVAIYQPVIPHYRISLFNHLARLPNLELIAFCSDSIYQYPKNELTNARFKFVLGSCLSFFSFLYFQKKIFIPKDFSRGDVIVICGNPRFVSNFFIVKEAKKRKIAIIWWGHLHSATSILWRSKIRYRIMKSCADMYLFYYKYEADIFKIQNREIDSSKIRYINNTIDVSNSTRNKDMSKETLRKRFSIDAKYVLLFCGRLRKGTNLDVLIRALAIVIKSIPDTILLVIGDGPEKNKYLNCAARYDIEFAIRWMGAIYDEKTNSELFACSDVFVYPGSVGLSFIHALFYGLPIITHRDLDKHYPEAYVLRDYENSLLFKRNDLKDLSEKIILMLNDRFLRSRLAINSRNLFECNFRFADMCNLFESSICDASRAVL